MSNLPDVPTKKTPRKFILSNIVILGLVSFFTDIGTEMVYPILPLYLTSVLGASAGIVGLIEGIAESFASILKLFSGMLADKFGNKKQLAFIGYFSSFFNKIILLFSYSWGGVLLARIVDRFGKGVRTAPRDALVAEAAEKGKLGRAYGLHKALDMLGTSLGILFASLFLIFFGDNAYRNIFIISMIPSLIGPVCVLFVKEKQRHVRVKKLNFRWRSLDNRLKWFLVLLFIFTLGNSSNAFILLRATSVGFSSTTAIFLYFIYNLVASLLSYPIGRLSDKIDRKYLLCSGYLLYSFVYFGIGFSNNAAVFVGLFVVYGIYTALTSGCERALVAEIAPPRLKSSILGLHSAILGIGLLPASVIAGALWESVGPSAPFALGGFLALFASAAIFIVLSQKPQKATPE